MPPYIPFEIYAMNIDPFFNNKIEILIFPTKCVPGRPGRFGRRGSATAMFQDLVGVKYDRCGCPRAPVDDSERSGPTGRRSPRL